ncbi:MAG TPA: class D beta-lactamase [Alcaligenaceae bacterium]|nr:class D beta-lactamase [Alcaligenaceae bacterium]
MRHLLILALCFFSAASSANDDALGEGFKTNNATGTLVIQSLHHGTTYVWNQERSTKRFASASTFKIFNTLIAVDEGVFDSVNDQFIWDGTQYEFSDWNRNLSLPMAYKASCVWCYQKLAERLGAAKYLDHLRRAQYGEIDMPFEGTTFWLDGSFKVSAVDQIEFLKKLYTQSLPYKSTSYDVLKTIMQAQSTPNYQLYAKTGWARRVTPEIGWYVGYVETRDDVWFFALNMDIASPDQLVLRQQLTLEAFEAQGIIAKRSK